MIEPHALYHYITAPVLLLILILKYRYRNNEEKRDYYSQMFWAAVSAFFILDLFIPMIFPGFSYGDF